MEAVNILSEVTYIAISLSFRRGLGKGSRLWKGSLPLLQERVGERLQVGERLSKFLHREDKEVALQRHATGRKMNDAEPFLLVVDTKRTEQVYILHGSILALKDILKRIRKDEFIALSLKA